MKVKVEPGQRSSGLVFRQNYKSPLLTKSFQKAVSQGIEEAMLSGPLAGFACIDIRVDVLDIRIKEDSTDETSLKIAANLVHS